MDKPSGEAAAPDFFQEDISKDLCFCSSPSHLVAFGKDVRGASPGHKGIAAEVGGNKESSLTGDRPSPGRASSSHAPLPFMAEPRNKRNANGLNG